MSARGRRRLPALAEEDEGDEAVSKGCSPDREWRQSSGVTIAEDDGGSFTSRER
jgi:hypothetical protein